MAEHHPIFTAPPNPDVHLWRYMDFSKFVMLLQQRSLYFARADKLGDSFEGSFTQANIKVRSETYAHVVEGIRDDLRGTALDKISEWFSWVREWTYVSCWHMNDHESVAMWKVYSRSAESIAIRTTYRRLFEMLPEKSYLGMVNYVDYDTELFSEANTLVPFVHKRKCFAYEQEIRAVTQEFPYEGETILMGNQNPDCGIHVPIDLDALVDAIFVSPDAPDRFAMLVSTEIKKYGYNINVTQSRLNEDPLF